MQTKLTSAVAKLDSDSESSLGDRRLAGKYVPGHGLVNGSSIQDNSHSNVMYRGLPASESPPPPGVCPFPPTAMVFSMRGVGKC